MSIWTPAELPGSRKRRSWLFDAAVALFALLWRARTQRPRRICRRRCVRDHRGAGAAARGPPDLAGAGVRLPVPGRGRHRLVGDAGGVVAGAGHWSVHRGGRPAAARHGDRGRAAGRRCSRQRDPRVRPPVVCRPRRWCSWRWPRPCSASTSGPDGSCSSSCANAPSGWSANAISRRPSPPPRSGPGSPARCTTSSPIT